jgi:serine/threonine protein phosphatase 1
VRLYAVGDIHGRLDLLDILLELIGRDAASARERKVIRLFVGDYVDRGPHSSAVVARLLQLQREEGDCVFLRGNHDQMMLEFRKNAVCYPRWRALGAEETLQSYGVAPPIFEDPQALEEARQALVKAVPPAHWAFLDATQLSHVSGDYLFVHAGIRPGVFLEEQKPHDMMWIREEFLSSALSFEKFVVHGHSPSDKPDVRANRIGIDTRAFRTGRLTALCLEGDKKRFLRAAR